MYVWGPIGTEEKHRAEAGLSYGLPAVDTIQAIEHEQLLAVGWVDRSSLGPERPVLRGWVAPPHRRRGLGTELLRYIASRAATTALRIDRILRPDAEAPPGHAIEIYDRAGFRFNYLEDEMRRSLDDLPPASASIADITVAHWTSETHHRVHDTYNSAFRTRGAAPISADAWNGWFDGQTNFRAGASFLALHGMEVVGFLFSSGISEGWVDSIGVIPAWRGRGIAAALLSHALKAFRAGGEVEAGLRVNADNPAASRLYTRLGFSVVRRHYTFVKAIEA